MEVLGEIQDWLDGDLGVGLGAPFPDLCGGHRAGGLLEAGEAAGTHQRGLGEVHVQDDRTLAACAARHSAESSGRRRGPGLLVAGQVAGGDRAAHVQRISRTQ